MASLNNLSDAFSKISLTKVNPKGFAFAVDEQGQTVFVPAKFVKEIRAGNNMVCVETGAKGKSVKYVNRSKKVKSDQNWGEWQIGEGQVALPDTEEGDHVCSVVLQCWKCGVDLIQGAEIYKIKNGAVWANEECFDRLGFGEEHHNKRKKTVYGEDVLTRVVHCIECKHDVGSMFEEYVDDETGKPEGPFPRCKITVCRQQKSSNHFINHTVLKSNSRKQAETIVNALNPNNKQFVAPKKNDVLTHYAQQAEQKAVERLCSSWRNPPSRSFNNGEGSVYTIDPIMISDGIDCLEQTEFNFAAQQLIRLTGKKSFSIISSIEVYKNPIVETKWHQKKQQFATMLNTDLKHIETVWVFHGTGTEAMQSICENGFRVPRCESEVAHGAVHGLGVYTAIGPDTPIQYSQCQGSSAAILSQALVGRRGPSPRKNQEAPPDVDSWIPKGDWIVFKDPAQLLPKYIIHYD